MRLGMLLRRGKPLLGRSLALGLAMFSLLSALLVSDAGAQAPIAVPSSLPPGMAGSNYTAVLQASGGTPPYLWTVATGTLPNGLVLNSSGTLSGIPGAPGHHTLHLRVTDATGAAVAANVTVAFGRAPDPAQRLDLVTSVGRLYAISTDAPTTSSVLGVGGIVSITSSAGLRFIASRLGHIVLSASGLSRAILRLPRRAGTVVAIATAPGAGGYWVATSSGRVFGVGSVRSLGGARLTRRTSLVAMAPSPTVTGYWLLTSDGRVRSFGAAPFLGDQPGGAPAVTIGATPTGDGYWVVNRAGKVHAFGDALNLGSAPAGSAPVVAIAPAPTGYGYWLVSASGQIYNFGTAQHLSSLPNMKPGPRVVAAVASG